MAKLAEVVASLLLAMTPATAPAGADTDICNDEGSESLAQQQKLKLSKSTVCHGLKSPKHENRWAWISCRAIHFAQIFPTPELRSSSRSLLERF